jgi:ATP-dependent protease HslVU (ClpYQ) peptidase subunit
LEASVTTVAFKDGVIASDSQITCEGIAESTMPKIARNVVGDLAGASGSAAFIHAFLTWFAGGEKGEAAPSPTENDGGIIVRAGGSIECYEHPGPSPFVLTAKTYAIGSGRKLALGAMAFGASAEEAIKVAAQYDIYTSGKIVTLTH